MVAVKAHQAAQFLKSIDPRYRAYLFFGSDAGLVSERAQLLARKAAESDTPPSEVLRLDDLDLENDPDRLSVELLTVPMFGGRKIVRATAGRRITAAALKPLVEDTALAGLLIVEAGNLRPDESLRSLFEKSPAAAAIACYGDESQDIDGLIREVLATRRLGITDGARQMLQARLGADRALSRGEVEKLALYAAGQSEITEDDVEAIVGDASELTIDRIALAAASGDAARATREVSRALASGENAQAIIAAIGRHFQKLHRLRAAVDGGRSIDEAVAGLRPPLHFKQKAEISAQCRSWSGEPLLQALSGIASATKAARLNPSLEDTLAERLVLTLARMARERQSAPRAR